MSIQCMECNEKVLTIAQAEKDVCPKAKLFLGKPVGHTIPVTWYTHRRRYEERLSKAQRE